jgi:REP element-mobilizing transposase RayT
MDDDHVHFLIQSVPAYSVTKLVTMIKSLSAREIFKKYPHVKKQLWALSYGLMVILQVVLVSMVISLRYRSM